MCMAAPDLADRTTGELARSLAGDTATLVRKEVELARHELTEAFAARAKAAASAGIAVFAGIFALLFGALAAAFALDLRLTTWAAFLVVAVVFALAAAAAAGVAVARFRTPPTTPEETRRTMKENVEWARTQLRR